MNKTKSKSTKIRRHHLANWLGVTDYTLIALAEKEGIEMDGSFLVVDDRVAELLAQTLFSRSMRLTGGDMLISQAKKKAAYNQLLDKIKEDNPEDA